MKHLFKVLFVIAFHFPWVSFAATLSVVGQMSEFFQRIDQEGELVDQNYYIGFSEVTALDEITVKEECFEKSSSTEVVDLLEAFAMNAIEILYADTEKFGPLRDELQLLLKHMGEALKDREVQICTNTYTPSYSDGHTVHYVKVDGELRFIFEEGYPD